MRSRSFALAAAALCTACWGCSRDSTGAADARPTLTGADGLPQIVDNGGPTLTSMKIVTVTWTSDDAGATMQDFDDKLGASHYWQETTTEYGLGPAKSVNVVVDTPPPSAWEDSQIDSWVQSNATSSQSGWPHPDGQTVYVVYLPSSVQLTTQGQDACTTYGGYHTDLDDDPDVAYALIPEGCYQGTGLSLVDNATSSAAHEIIEAATDPFSNESPAFIGFDGDHLAWELWTEWQDEVADACEFFNYAYYKEGADLPYLVQRIWSNANAVAGHDPCGPRLSGPYFDVNPQGLSEVKVTAVGEDAQTHDYTSLGWHIPPGQTQKVKVAFFTDASPSSGGPPPTWSVTASEGDCCTNPVGLLAFSPATITGKSGDVVELSITVKKAPPNGNAIPMAFYSTIGTVTHVRPALVGAY